MSEFKLIIGNKNYSSWSLRPWLVLKQTGLDFQEEIIPLYQPDSKKKILAYSPAGKVPILLHGKAVVWESLAICEYIAELVPEQKLWPENRAVKAWARSISHEMHAGFAPLRKNMPMNVRASHPGKGLNADVDKDITRIRAIWSECRNKFNKQGPFLFGHFTIADAMYAPVVFRFRTYGVPLSKGEQGYADHILNLPAILEWRRESAEELQTIAASEIYAKG